MTPNSGNAKELIDEAYKKTFNFVFQAKSWLKNGDIKKKRELLSELGSNSVLMGRILSISMPLELEIIKNGIKQEPAASARFEQANHLVNKGRTRSFEVVRPMWLSGWIAVTPLGSFQECFGGQRQALGSWGF